MRQYNVGYPMERMTIDVSKTRTTPRRPQLDWMVEHANRTIQNMIASYISKISGISNLDCKRDLTPNYRGLEMINDCDWLLK